MFFLGLVGQSLGLLFQKLLIVAFVRIDAASIDLQDARRHSVQEVAVVGDQHQCAGLRAQAKL